MEAKSKFKVGASNYATQYNNLYTQRTKIMKEKLAEMVKAKWGDGCKLAEKIIDTETNTGDDDSSDKDPAGLAIIGVLHKEMKKRDSVLEHFKDGTGNSLVKVNWTKNISDKEDTVLLEDDSGRASLGGALMEKEIPKLVGGIVVAVRGNVDNAGVFQVVDYLTYDGCYSNVDLYSDSEAGADPKYVMLVSGLRVGSLEAPREDEEDTDFSIQLLFDFLAGRLGGEEEVKKASRITKVIIAGNSVELPVADKEGAIAAGTVFGTNKTKLEKQQQEMSSATMKRFDAYLAQGLGSCHIDVMPGAEDPTTETLPQQILHPCLFPHSSRFDSLSLVTNPYDAKVDGCHLLGHSGQPVFDILRQTHWNGYPAEPEEGDAATPAAADAAMDVEKEDDGGSTDALKALQKTLEWGHICPTAPDTLSCYPFTDTDPFVIEQGDAPHVYFAGNQEKFESVLVEGGDKKFRTRVVCVPSFQKTGEVVLVDTASLEASVVSFR
jgi:DNA polymerase delta subunit 2